MLNKNYLLFLLSIFVFVTVFLTGCVNNTSTTPLLHQNEHNYQEVKGVNLSSLPKFVHKNFIELDKIYKISKFRSGVGHDFSRGFNETSSCRSMKHYFEPIGVNESFWTKYHEGNFSESDWPVVKYFSPVSGKVVDLRSSKNALGEVEKQFLIQSKEYPSVYFGFFHVLTNLSLGEEVEAGQFIGTISPGNSGEIAVSVRNGQDEQLISFFELIDDEVFSEYESRGVKSREELIISKKERDEKPLKCSEEEPHKFIGNWFTSNKEEYDNWANSVDNWVFLKKV